MRVSRFLVRCHLLAASCLLVLCCLLPAASPAHAAGPGATEVRFKDNATNELGFKVERKEILCATAGPFVEVATVPVSVPPGATVLWTDTATVAGKDYCYRVRAFNNSKLDGTGTVQFSGYTNEAGVSYPLAIPADPSGATAQ